MLLDADGTIPESRIKVFVPDAALINGCTIAMSVSQCSTL